MTVRGLLVAGVLLAYLAEPAVAGTPARKPTPGASHHAATPARRLDDIHIEGEIPVPQVLFITARDQRRFMDFQQQRYLRTSRQLGEDTIFPTWVVVTRPASEARKEKHP